jgi:hypothetical protein
MARYWHAPSRNTSLEVRRIHRVSGRSRVTAILTPERSCVTAVDPGGLHVRCTLSFPGALLIYEFVRVPDAGYLTQPNESDEPVLQDTYDWTAIKAHVGDVYFVNSPDDLYGCDDE